MVQEAQRHRTSSHEWQLSGDGAKQIAGQLELGALAKAQEAAEQAHSLHSIAAEFQQLYAIAAPHVQRHLRVLAYVVDAVWAERGRKERLSSLPCVCTQLSAEVAQQVGRVLQESPNNRPATADDRDTCLKFTDALVEQEMGSAAQVFNGVSCEKGKFRARLYHPALATLLKRGNKVHLCYCTDADVAAFLRDLVWLVAGPLLNAKACQDKQHRLASELNFTDGLELNVSRYAPRMTQ